jgi:sterol desaturase/sphingolipid hydroxylase (fatty acid hydroxylase superfamily)
MAEDPFAISVPFFLLLIALELGLTRLLARPVYRFGSLLSDLGCGIVQQVLWIFFGAAVVGSFAWVYEHARLVQIDRPWLAWTLGFVGVDFCYYWAHRASHRANLLWAAHVVHHQSEDMNFAVALRQPFTDIFLVPFLLPVSLVLPATTVATFVALNNVYQFWIHNEWTRRLGPLEWVMNTPSHHRVHHGINPQYIDKNYGGILILWDRLFGTFEEERERAVYGTLVPVQSFDPIWAQVQPWVHLVATACRAPRWADKALVWFMPPEWSPAGLPPYTHPERAALATRRKWEVDPTSRAKVCLVLQFALAGAATFLLVLHQSNLTARKTTLAAAVILLTLTAASALLEGRRWARSVELGWLAALALGAAPFVGHVLEAL